MKKLLFIAVLAGCLCGCTKKSRWIWAPVVSSHYFIARYVEGDMRLEYGFENDRDPDYGPYPKVLFIDWDIHEQYLNPVFSDPEAYEVAMYYDIPVPPLDQIDPADTERFIELSERNGDYLYYAVAKPPTFYERMVALSDNFSSILVTSDVDWDDEHPAGTPLNDILELEYRAFAEGLARGGFSQNDDGTEFGLYRKKMNELTLEDLNVVTHIPEPEMRKKFKVHPTAIRFPSPPDDTERERHLTVTMTTTEGIVKQASIRYEPPRDDREPPWWE